MSENLYVAVNSPMLEQTALPLREQIIIIIIVIIMNDSLVKHFLFSFLQRRPHN